MSAKRKALDLYCRAGGAGKGYIDAGFDVTGVDIEDMPDYPGTFIQGDAIAYLAAHGHEYDIHWTDDRKNLAEAIPPAYTRFIGGQIMQYLDSVQAIDDLKTEIEAA